ncbi:hypothetical protein CEXT_521881 [Caerostris extrusa]|uniref:Secreted protein n=1 Tax=Caerostris extrusa TaxID=172846 RepID=A0AAV4XXL7_CAEEX|nr:hypothetical protein CEXT_521881 [Caerostris extrusa]
MPEVSFRHFVISLCLPLINCVYQNPALQQSVVTALSILLQQRKKHFCICNNAKWFGHGFPMRNGQRPLADDTKTKLNVQVLRSSAFPNNDLHFAMEGKNKPYIFIIYHRIPQPKFFSVRKNISTLAALFSRSFRQTLNKRLQNAEYSGRN